MSQIARWDGRATHLSIERVRRLIRSRHPYGVLASIIPTIVSHVTADIWGVHMSGKHYIQVRTRAKLSDCFGSATQPHESMKEVWMLGDGT